MRELAKKSKIDASTISLLENLHRTPHGRTARELAASLEVTVADLYGSEMSRSTQIEPRTANTNKTPTTPPVKSAVSSAKKKKRVGENCWVVDFEVDTYGPFMRDDAERIKQKLGKDRVYEGANKDVVWEQHRHFLVAVANGRQLWKKARVKRRQKYPGNVCTEQP